MARTPALPAMHRAPGRDEGREEATAIPEDAKQDKYFYDCQKQTHHDASVRTTCILFIISASPSWGHGRRFFSLASNAGEHAQLFGCPPATHAQQGHCPNQLPPMLDHVLGLEPGRNGWTILLLAAWPCLSHGTFFFFPRKQVPSAVVDEDITGEEPCHERSPGRSELQSRQPRVLKYIYSQACACDASIPNHSCNSIYRGRAGGI